MIKLLKFFATKFSSSDALTHLEEEINVFLSGPVELLSLKMSSSWDEGSELAIAIVYRPLPETLPVPALAEVFGLFLAMGDYPEFVAAFWGKTAAQAFIWEKLMGQDNIDFEPPSGGPAAKRPLAKGMKVTGMPLIPGPGEVELREALQSLREPEWVQITDEDGWIHESGYFVAQIGP